MIRVLVLALIVVGGATGTTGVAQAADRGWTAYENERFGFVLRYPADLFAIEGISETGDGVTFVSRDGAATLAAGALVNTEGYSPQSYQRHLARESYPRTRVDYAPVGRTWAVLSGERDGKIFYEKAMFTCGGRIIQSFVLIYPTAERGLYDGVVERIEDAFRPGPQGCRNHDR